MHAGLTNSVQHIIVSVRRGEQARCPKCDKLFIEEMDGTDTRAVVTCRDRRHPRGEAVRIEFRTE